ncbi:MAG: SsrA-binding protein SmpB [Puniceicoccales bacterium]|jgi:SsrA-binding protein|nr:SsrA-binding protein SmpB [Puniceicoccales bacterium]
MAAKKDGAQFQAVVNRKAGFRYTLLQHFEAGVALQGTEVKAFRAGSAQIGDAFVRINRKGVPMLLNAHIDEYAHGTDANHAPTRPRNLLLHKREIDKLRAAQEKDGMSIIPTRMYLKHGLVKVDIALCKGKDMRDRRRELKQRTESREVERAMANLRRQ